MSDGSGARCGFVAIVGRPNVGKSTLLNALIRHKISITSPRPQTTRHNLLGIRNLPLGQIIYVDTPGLHHNAGKAMNRYMNRSAMAALTDVDCIVFVVEALRWTAEDTSVLEHLAKLPVPVIAAANKVDQVSDKKNLLPWLQTLAQRMAFGAIVPVSARQRENIQELEGEVVARLPVHEALFPADQLTDRSERFLAAEIVREKLTRRLGKELPYALTVEIERFETQAHIARIAAVIWVERAGQKAIVIGKGGAVLKKVGEQARHDMEGLFGGKVFLQLWVKVREGWSDDERALRSLGYSEP